MKKSIIAMIAVTGLLVGCNRSIEGTSQKFNELPRDVQKTVRAHAPNAEIASVDKKTQDGMVVYEITFNEPGKNPSMTVAADGRMLSTDKTTAKGAPGTLERVFKGTGATGTKLSALPEKVQKTIQTQAPNADIEDINRKEKDGVVFYEVEFRDKGKNPTMCVAEDGTLLQPPLK
jgi:uncharacterized membrane protein YkoI